LDLFQASTYLKESLKIHFCYKRLQFPSAALSAKNRPQRGGTTLAAFFDLRLAEKNFARFRLKSNF
jgi:hypothetical protein